MTPPSTEQELTFEMPPRKMDRCVVILAIAKDSNIVQCEQRNLCNTE